jgi:PAS domain S-box-containing protein
MHPSSSSQHLLFDANERRTELARRIIDALFVFIGLLSRRGVLLEANAAPLKAAGFTLDQVRGKKIWECYWWNYSPELQDQLRNACEQAANGDTVRFDAVVRMLHDTRVAIDFQVAPLRDRFGNVTYLVASAVDISRRKHAENAVRERDRRKDAFIATLAHELRNPLAPIRNALEILVRVGSPDPRAAAAASIIARQVNHLVALVDDLLDIARISSGRLKLEDQICDMGEIALQVAEDYRATLEAAGCSLDVRTAQEALLVRADPVRLGQMVRNYLQNAGRFAAGARVTVECVRNVAANTATLTVTDTGRGFTPESAATLFQAFGQADQGLRRAEGGMGLGLALTKGLAQLQGGTVAARSKGPGQGASFEFTLPLAAERAQATEPATTPQEHLAGDHILVVEDSDDTAQTLAMLLEAQGYSVFVAPDAPKALALAEEHHPEVVISDIGLPGMSGYELAQALRSMPAFSQTLLVALSGYADAEARALSRHAGFDVHLAKPVAPNDLLTLLETCRQAVAKPTGRDKPEVAKE